MTRIPGAYAFNVRVALDSFTAFDAAGNHHSFVGILCLGARFHVVAHIGKVYGPPPAALVWKCFTQLWSAWAGTPQGIAVDQGARVRR